MHESHVRKYIEARGGIGALKEEEKKALAVLSEGIRFKDVIVGDFIVHFRRDYGGTVSVDVKDGTGSLGTMRYAPGDPKTPKRFGKAEAKKAIEAVGKEFRKTTGRNIAAVKSPKARSIIEALGNVHPNDENQLRADLNKNLPRPVVAALFRLNNIVGDWGSIFRMMDSGDPVKGELSGYIDAMIKDCQTVSKELGKWKARAKKKGI